MENVPSGWLEPLATGENIDVLDSPSMYLNSINVMLQRNVTKPILEPMGIGVPEWRLLLFIETFGTNSLGALAKSMWMDRAQINRSIQTLTEKGFLQRHADPTHSVRFLINITPEGRNTLNHARVKIAEIQAEMLLLLDRDERATLYRALTKINAWAVSKHQDNPTK